MVMMKEQKIKISREDQAKLEIGHTAVSRGTALWMIAVFLLIIAGVPVAQHAAEIVEFRRGTRDSAWPPACSALSAAIVGRQCYDIFRRAPTVLGSFFDRKGGPVSRVIGVNRELLHEMRAYENAIDDESVVGQLLRPHVQYVLARILGAGNERAYCGRGNWLFFQPDINYLIHPGFLDSSRMARRAAAVDEWIAPPQPDPVKAIVDFDRQLAERGIKLIVVPTPVKPMIHPEKFARAFDNGSAPLQNLSYDRFVAALTELDIPVFDCAAALAAAAREGGQPLYLSSDTHWRPKAVELAARLLAGFVRAHVELPVAVSPGYVARAVTAEQLGDVAMMLKLPADQSFYRLEEVQLRQVLAPGGTLWAPDPSSDVLVLGDSFSNIYSQEGLGWGESAGLIEQLSFELMRPLDRIVQNDNGSYATRAILARELARGRDRLAGKRVVVYQFACRELAEGDWKITDLTLGAPVPATFVTPAPGTAIVVRGVVRSVSPAPRPGTVPYKDHIISLHLVDLDSDDDSVRNGQAFVYTWSMTNNTWTRAARFRPDDTVTLRLRPWSDVQELDGINRSEPADEALVFQDPCWGEEP